MVKLTVLYGHPVDAEAFERYYAETHVPLALKIPYLVRIEATKVVGVPGGGSPAYYRTADLWFESQERLDAAMGSPEGQTTTGDLANFATGGVTVLIAEVTAAQGHL
jgi:uncharacterized protein (TIGR02118 family)